DNAVMVDKDTCLKWDDDKKNVLLLGDSHAAHLWYGLSETKPDWNVMQATISGCRPFVTPRDLSPRCHDLVRFIYDEYLPSHKVEAVLLAGRWVYGDLARLSRTIPWFREHGIKVIVFGPMVEYDSPLPRLLASGIRYGSKDIVERHRISATRDLD